MTYLTTVPPEQAQDALLALYEQDIQNNGYIANYTHALSLRPEVIVAWRNLIRAIRSNMDLRRFGLASIGAARALRCSY